MSTSTTCPASPTASREAGQAPQESFLTEPTAASELQRFHDALAKMRQVLDELEDHCATDHLLIGIVLSGIESHAAHLAHFVRLSKGHPENRPERKP